MDIKEAVGRIFKIDPRIRYVGVVDSQYRMLESKMRDGVSSLTPEEVDRNFFSIYAPILTDTLRRLETFTGPVGMVSVRCEKALILFYPWRDHVVVLSLEPSAETPLLDKIADGLRRILE